VEQINYLDPLMALTGIIFIVYTVNIYNFMDGIDQLAISQAIFFAVASTFIFGWIEFMFSLIFVSFFLINYKKTNATRINTGYV
jgi:UDP-N-acetylmuramyl pentapeptide phosphotransferase/UDP-N-acetylglucosamine-1-phosphate transferase